MSSLTFIENHWYTGEPKRRCYQCRKVVFVDQAAAKEAAEKISVREPMRAYLGACGHWHVTRRRSQ
jgi:hypothetical protein